MFSIHSHGATDIGRKRKHNEDAFCIDESIGLFVVADGLGGHAAGEVASAETVETIHAWIRREQDAISAAVTRPDHPEMPIEVRKTVERAVMAATYHVFSIAEYDAAKAGMGTTVSVLLVVGGAAVVAQVGDSRIYRVRGGVVTQLTDDHTLIAMQVRDGLLTEEEARRAPHRNVITRAVGSHEYVQVDTAAFPLVRGDVFLLCTDGLHGYLATHEIVDHLRDPPDVATTKLIALANARGGKDNITAVVVQVGD